MIRSRIGFLIDWKKDARAAVRLARDDISRPSPRISSVLADSVALARTILEKIVHH
jgi:hypothetical protein